MELIAILYFAIIPGCIIGFLIGFFRLFRKWNIVGRILISIVTGLLLGYISPCFLCFINGVRSSIKHSHAKEQAIDEVKYFKEVAAGKYNSKEIRDHYTKHPLSGLGAWTIVSDKNIPGTLAYKKVVLQLEVIPVLIEMFAGHSLLVGALANLPETPTELKLKVADHPDYQAVRDMAENEKTPTEVLLRLSTYKEIDIARIVSNNSNAPEVARVVFEIRNSLDNGSLDPKERKKPPGFNSEVDKKAWSMLANDNRENVRLWVARHPFAPSRILFSMSDDPSEKVLRWVFLNNNATDNTAKKIAKHFNATVEEYLIRLSKPNNEETFVESTGIRKAVAQNKRASSEILRILSHDDCGTVKNAVAMNPLTTSDILETLSYDSDYQMEVAKHPHTPIVVLKRLINENNQRIHSNNFLDRVSLAAIENLDNRGIRHGPVEGSR